MVPPHNQVKVAVLTSSIPPYNLSLYRKLADRVDLRVFVSRLTDRHRKWEITTDGISVVHQSTLTIPYKRKHPLGFHDQNYYHLPYDTLNQLVRYRPHVIISAHLGLRSALAAFYRKINPKSRLIVWTNLSEHTERGTSRAKTLQRMMILRTANAVLVNGVSGSNYVERLGVPRQRIIYLPYTIDLSSFLAIPLERDPETARRFIYFGQLIDRKGLLPFMEVLAAWLQGKPGEKCELWIVGDGPVGTMLRTKMWPAGLSIRLLGDVPYSQLPAFYAQAGILVFPTLADEWGVVVNEALAAGMPVLGSRYSQAVDEIIEDDVNGWTFLPDRPDSTRAAIEQARRASLSHLDRMRVTCRDRIQQLTPEYGAQKIVEAIDFVISGSNRACENLCATHDPGPPTREVTN